jgi:uncharacterized protein YkwD
VLLDPEFTRLGVGRAVGGTEATALTEPAPAGQVTPAAAVAAWLVTAHDLLLDPAFVDAGVGVVASDQGQGPGQVNWTAAPAAPAGTA